MQSQTESELEQEETEPIEPDFLENVDAADPESFNVCISCD